MRSINSTDTLFYQDITSSMKNGSEVGHKHQSLFYSHLHVPPFTKNILTLQYIKIMYHHLTMFLLSDIGGYQLISAEYHLPT